MNATLTRRFYLLSILDSCGDYTLPEPTLLANVRLVAGRAAAPLDSELRELLRKLDGEGLIVGLEADGERHWKITTAGRAKLAEWGA